jgi:CheY-like chemotaxis protein
MIQSAAKHATGLTERLLSFSRRAKRRLEEVNINALTKNVLLLVRSSMGRKILITSDLEKGLPPVVGDRTQFEQMLINILINARDAMPGGGTIHIRTSRTTIDEEFCKTHLGTVPGENVMITISDTGSGMSEKTRRQIFEPFFSTKKEGQGTGLGLSIVHSVVRGHSGYIDVESMEGKGTKFTIYLPALQGKSVKRTSAKRRRLRKEQTILLVQNEDKTMSALKKSLTELGFRTLVASDDDEAVRILEESLEEVNLAIVDSLGGERDSAETFGRLRSAKPDLKMIVSCPGSPGRTGETLLDGTARLIHKPVKLDELSAAVRQLLGSSGK